MARVNEFILHVELFENNGLPVHVRVWAKADDLRSIDERAEKWATVTQVASDVVMKSHMLETTEVAEAIAKLPFCNAVEVIFGTGSGIIIYPEWP